MTDPKPESTLKEHWFGPPRGDGYYALGFDRWCGNHPVWTCTAADRAEVAGAAGEFVLDSVDMGGGRRALLIHVDIAGRHELDAIISTPSEKRERQ